MLKLVFAGTPDVAVPSLKAFAADPRFDVVGVITRPDAPTGRGRQSPTIIAVTSEGYRQKISELNAAVLGSDSDPYYGAPVIILVLADGTANTFVEDGSCVLENMMLAAASLGLGSVWVHREREIFDSEEGKALLQAWGLPETLRGVGSIALGYPAGTIHEAAKRKDGYIVRV